jgi:hypothetical protein
LASVRNRTIPTERPPLVSEVSVRWVERERKNSVASVRKRTIPTKRPPLISEVSARWVERLRKQLYPARIQHNGILCTYSPVQNLFPKTFRFHVRNQESGPCPNTCMHVWEFGL